MVVRLSLFYSVLTLVGCSFSSRTAKKLFAEAEKKQYDVIVVPGVPLENGKWSRTMKGRIYWSKFLYEKGIAKNIMYSGSAVYTPYYEGMVMAMYAEALGIPREHIFTETRAEHSTENIYYSYYKAKQLGFKTIALASDPFQTKSLRRFVRKKLSSDVDVIPFVVDTLKVMEPAMTDPVIDYEQAFDKNFKSIKERESPWRRLKGTYGKNIDTTAYRSEN